MLLLPRSTPSTLRARTTFLALGAALALVAQSSWAAPTVGFVENWSGPTTNGWGGSGLITYSNPGTGGLAGAGDGFLHFLQGAPGNFGTRSTGSEYVGDWLAAGITQLRLWLNDVETDQPFSIHVAVGGFGNLWEYDAGFVPPENLWGEFVVDLTDSTDFTHIISANGLGFAAAIQTVEVLHVRHDLPPFVQTPDPIAGEIGIDHILLTDGLVGVGPRSAGSGLAIQLAPPSPNPSRGPVALTATAAGPVPVRFEILDLAGRIVRRAELPAGSGPRVWVWDGLDSEGRRVPSGAYRVFARGPAGGASRPLVRIE